MTDYMKRNRSNCFWVGEFFPREGQTVYHPHSLSEALPGAHQDRVRTVCAATTDGDESPRAAAAPKRRRGAERVSTSTKPRGMHSRSDGTAISWVSYVRD